MGVPKFFRYTSERYPCLNELVKQYQIPDFDNMYLDMNGIIHNCSHPDDSNPHFRITEQKIFEDIFHYISILFQIIKPKKLFFMAIDGVAPRAKMNQQRGRRFRSAREAEKLEEDAKAKGEVLPTEKRFDSNCITPGTVFMARLHEQLRFFVKEKMSTDPLWKKVKVILSGHETPGEGEHKIMDYIRWARSEPDYDPNTRHCLYGLDADLIMLGMCTHEPHFALLREEVKFGKTTQRTTSPEETNFYLLHLSLLREYLEQEFIAIKDKLPFDYDIEKVVDDWVLMGFLVGNDFIPNLPNMNISNDALPVLYNTYMTVLPTLDGYINEAGDLNLRRFEVFMQELAKLDKEKFQDTYADLKYFEAKTGRRPNAQERREYKPNNDETFNINIENIKANKPDDELQALINATHDMFIDEMENDSDDDYEEISDEEANIEMEFKLHKKDYYMNKLDYSKVTDEVLADQAEGYVRAIQWNLWYYYKGCPSWCWYYPHHYAPYISDVKGFVDLKIEFELGDPFKPFEQLLAVLPAASRNLLPAPFHALMTDEESPIVHYYPVNFETDLNGKRNDWEAVVLIPFIDEVNLLSAMAPCYQRLTEEEHKRNSHGPMLVYNWTPGSQGPAVAPEYFAPIASCHAAERSVWRHELAVAPAQLRRGMLPNARRDQLFPGFPTLRHLAYQTSLKKCKVKVFDQPSRNENMIVELINQQTIDPPLEQTASEFLGKVVWVGWPHLTRAKVISVSNEKMRLHHVDKENNNANGPTYTTESNFGSLHRQWISERSTIIEHNMNRLGIELGEVKVILHAVNLKGYKYIVQDNVQMVLEPEWCSIPCGYALQATVKDVSAHIVQEAGKFSTPQEAYPTGDHVYLLTQGQYYGSLATILEADCSRGGRIKVSVTDRIEPTPVVQTTASPYRTAHQAAASCGISAQMLSRITGTVLVAAGERNDLPTDTLHKVNLGLNLKFNKKNQEVSGYTRRCKVTNSWLYSDRCVDLVKAYARNFPDLIGKLAYMSKDVFFEGDLWPTEIGQKKHLDVVTWLKAQPHETAQRRECGSDALEPEDMKSLAESLDKQLKDLKGKVKKVALHVKWNLLYKPELHEGNIPPDPRADFKLYDRVVSVARHISVPFGATGTITAVYHPTDCNTVRLSDKMNAEASYQVMFDEPFPGGMTEDMFDEPRFYRMLPTNMLNISYGRKLRISAKFDDSEQVFGVVHTPSMLRRDDGHHSAFASYSPPGDNKPLDDIRKISPAAPVAAASNGQQQDNATHLLRSLLKISENETDSTKRSNRALLLSNHFDERVRPNQAEQNWRMKSENNIIQLPPVQRGQTPPNWRKESAVTYNNNRSQLSEWTNAAYKNQPPVPPYPTFGQPPPPGPNTMPFPLFQNPHFQQRNHSHYHQDTQRPPNSQFHNRPYGSQPTFPKHLPSVSGANVTLGPSWNKDHNSFQQEFERSAIRSQQHSTTSNSSGNPDNNIYPDKMISPDKIINPFVPLQVQTSQRRVHNSGGPSAMRNLEGLPASMSMMPQANSSMQPMEQRQEGSSKPQRKKKPRIAANLPFQID